MIRASNVLSLAERVFEGTELRGRLLRRTLRVPVTETLLEFVIDGHPLGEAPEIEECIARPDDQATDLGERMPGTAAVQVERLLGIRPDTWEQGRVWLLFCPVCHDEGCGGVSAAIDRVGDWVIWSDFTWDNPFDQPLVRLQSLVRVSRQRFAFDATRYDALLMPLLAHYRQLDAARGRRRR
ncbi:hypothetical protein [Occultella kanbiaonis]|uniref:hypothetical protein n=1 Tax=Occultella kanbiaonis TaxID=2675754 RepID=UPI0013D6072C|nr:hypothetical protein [Occultella kanbiaonis]